ncbi:MAG: c-type cytochrome [Anaerolineae bacterium]|nr:c-type cytochrome [Anaerolineae bacterium]
MQVKVVIGTVAFMLTMVVLGYAALREPTRLEDFAGAAHGRSVEQGAYLYINNCATCHGLDGTATSGLENGCRDANGDPNCLGLPLNNYFLLCGNPPRRSIDLGWQGTTENLIKRTVAAGRGAIMPAWSNDFGGPMRPDQVQNVTNYVLNWGSEELCAEEPVTFPWPEFGPGAAAEFQALTDPVEIVAGDPELGAQAYLSNGCNACHGIPDGDVAATVGPSLTDVATNGAERIEGYSAQDYIYESILEPNAFISPECPNGACTSPSLMPGTFALTLSRNPQDMANLLAYLMGDAYTHP